MDKIVPIKNNKFYCEKCDYSCSKSAHWKQHLLTAKHKNGISATYNGIQKSPSHFSCIFCNKIYKHRSGQYRHQKKCKNRHSQLVKISQKLAKKRDSEFICECGKIYKHASSLSKHRKQCIYLHLFVQHH